MHYEGLISLRERVKRLNEDYKLTSSPLRREQIYKELIGASDALECLIQETIETERQENLAARKYVVE